MPFPRFTPAATIRPVSLLGRVAFRTRLGHLGGLTGSAVGGCPLVAPYGAIVARDITDRCTLTWRSGEDVLEAEYAEGRVWLRITTAGHTTEHRSRRYGRARTPIDQMALTLTGTHLTVLTRGSSDAAGAAAATEEDWTARAQVDLRDRVDTRDEAWLAELMAGHQGDGVEIEAGSFGQVGLRDLRVATYADGTPYRLDDGRAVLTATSAGPGFFDTAHQSVWALDAGALALEHLSDLYIRRPGRAGVFGDHASHLIRDGEQWLVATSTWGAFEADPRESTSSTTSSTREDARVAITLARTDADLLSGEHVLDTEPLAVPTTGFTSVGVWDPHLIRTEDGWLVGYVSARRFWRFHPVVASGPSLDRLEVCGVDPQRRATEGTTLARMDGRWVVLASDGRDGRRGQRGRYPVFDLAMREIGALDAPYPTNLPWPTLLPVTPDSEEQLLVGFDGRPWGGSTTAGSTGLLGYGTHGDVVIARSVSPGR